MTGARAIRVSLQRVHQAPHQETFGFCNKQHMIDMIMTERSNRKVELPGSC